MKRGVRGIVSQLQHISTCSSLPIIRTAEVELYLNPFTLIYCPSIMAILSLFVFEILRQNVGLQLVVALCAVLAVSDTLLPCLSRLILHSTNFDCG